MGTFLKKPILWRKIFVQNSDGITPWVANAGSVRKIAFFARSRSLRLRRITAENLCPSATVVSTEEYRATMSSTTMIVVEVCWSQLRSMQLTSTTLVVVEVCLLHFSVTCMWHGASHVRCATVEPTATMRVQNYAGGWIKSGSCWKCLSGWHAICLHYSYNSMTTFQLTQSVARASRR